MNPNAIINSDHGPIIINIHDSVIGKHISQYGYWASDDIEIIKQMIDHLLKYKSTVSFYDVGANIGTHSIALSKIFQDRIKIRAFEAQRQIYNMMCGSLAINGINNVYCHNVAVSDNIGNTIEIALPDYNILNNFGGFELINPLRSDNQDMKKNHHEKIKTVTLDSYNEQVDFIKMDIEGMEDKALAGSLEVLQNSRPMCFIEILKTNVDYIIDTFSNANYCAYQKAADIILIPNEYSLQITGLPKIF